MKKTMMGAALTACVLASGAATPARATDVATAVLGVQALVTLGFALSGAQNQGGTSVNTEYALTGQGTPVDNGRYAARQPVRIVCHPYPGTCRTEPAH
ncbi:MAG: hypothetical protein AAFP13_09920 [Pseudomonadota bacterium]